MTVATFNAYARYYDLLYRDKNYVEEANYIRKLLSSHGVAKGDLLEFGSGTGKHGCLLADRGYRVHGIERSAEMISRALVHNDFTSQQGNICTVQMGRSYDAVLSLFHVVSYQTDNERVLAMFSRAAEHLQPGGLFVFDFWYSPAVYAQTPSVRVKRMADKEIEITRIAEPELFPNENRVDVNYTIYSRSVDNGEVQTMQEKHSMRHFSLPEITLIAHVCGLVLIGAEEFLTSKQLGQDTWGACVILKRI